MKVKTHKIIILPVGLYGCETLSLAMSDKRRLRFFENRVARRIFRSKRHEVTGEWRRLHNEEVLPEQKLLSIYYLGDQFKKNEVTEHVARMGKMRYAHRVHLREKNHL
jgi:hypothetical protein